MLRDVEPGNRWFFFDPTSSSAARPRRRSARVNNLEMFNGVDAGALAPRGAAAFFKRALDIVISLAVLVALAPVFVITAIAVKMDSPGPALFRQARVGQGGRVFEVLKFRSMRTDAEKDGPQWASANDDRITRVGRFIRKFRIDELPQAFNVLKGEMSFVGPRPERPEFVCILEKEIPNYRLRHALKPGITGWAQVQYEYTASVEGAREKLKYDLFYVKKFTPILDIVIILLTVRVVLFGLGSR
ncbi:MAG: sugar transferase [Pseudomonadota bacterium]